MATDKDLKLSISAALNQASSIRDINQALKTLEKHPALKPLILKINIDNKWIQNLKGISSQTLMATTGITGFGAAMRTAAATASVEWTKLGETIRQIKSLVEGINLTSAETGINGLAASSDNAEQSIKELMTVVLTLASSPLYSIVENIPSRVKELTSTFKALAVAQGAATAATRVFAIALQGLSKAFLPLTIITGVVWGLSELYKVIMGNNDKSKEAAEINFEHVDSLKQQKDEVQKLASEYQALQAAQDSGYATIEQKQRLLEVQTELVKSYGVSANGIIDEGKAFLTSTELIQLRINAINEQIVAENELNKIKMRIKDKENTNKIRESNESIDNDKAQIEKFQKAALELKELQSKGVRSVSNVFVGTKKSERLSDKDAGSTNKIGIEDAQKRVLQKILDLSENVNTSNIELQTALSERTNILRNEIRLYLESLGESESQISAEQRVFLEGLLVPLASNGQEIDSQISSILAAYNKLQSSDFDKYISNFNVAKTAGNKGEMQNIRVQVDKLLEDFNKAIPITDSFKSVIRSLFDDTSSAKFSMSMEEASLHTKNSIAVLSSLEESYKKLNRGEKLSKDTISDLISNYPELAKHLSSTNDYTFKRGQLLDEVIKKERQDRIEQLSKSIETTKSLMDELENKRRLYSSFYSKVSGLFSSLTKITLPPVEAQLSPEDQKEFDELREKLETQEAQRKLLESSLNESLSSSSSIVSKYEPSLKLSKAQLEVDKYNRLLDENNQIIEQAKAKSETYDKRLANRLSLYSDLTSALVKLRTEQEKEQASLKTTLSKTGLIDSQGEVIDNVEQRLISLSKGSSSSRLGYTAEQLENFVSRYVELFQLINDTNTQLRTATTDIANTLQMGLDKISDAANRKKERANNRISLLGEINTEEEKKIVARYSYDIVQALIKQRNDISNEIDRMNELIRNTKNKQEKDGYIIYLENLQASLTESEVELARESEQLGKSQAESLIYGFDKQLEDLKYSKSLLGDIDTDEERKKAAEIDKSIHDVLLNGIDAFHKDIVELERKLTTNLTSEERLRAQAKLEILQGHVKKYQLEQAEAASAWSNSLKSATKDAMSAIEDFYEKQGKAAQKALDDQLEAYRSYIDERKKLLRRENESEDFNENRAKLQQEEMNLRNKIAEMSLDNSIEGKYKREQLEKELADKLEEIRKLELDRTRNLRDQNYDDLLKNKENEIKIAKDAADKKWQDDLAADAHYSALKEALVENSAMKMQDALANFSNSVQTYMDAIGASIDRNIIDKLADTQRFQNIANTINGIYNPFDPSPSTGAGNPTPSTKTVREADWEQYLKNKKEAEQLKNSDPRWEKLHKENNDLRIKWGFPDKSYAELVNLKYYHEGGEVGVDGTSTAKWWSRLLKSNEVLSVLKKGEAVINEPKAFVHQMVANVAQGMKLNPRILLTGSGTAGSITNYYEYDIHIDRVEGGEAGAKSLFKHIKTQSQRGNR